MNLPRFVARTGARWLAVACSLGGAELAAQEQPSPDSMAPGAAVRAHIEQLLDEFDELFAKADVAGYLAKFEADHEGALAMFGEHLAHLSQCTKSTHRESRVVTGPTTVGERLLLRLRHVVHWPAPAGDGEPREPFVEDSYLVVRRADDGGVVPTFAIEMPAETRCVRDGKFRCPPCNYEIGGVDGWLCVPLRRERALTFESATFYLLGTDVACDLSVLVEADPVPAKAAAQRMVHAFAKVEPGAEIALPEQWLPPTHEASPPAGLDGCRVEVRLPNDQPQRGGGRAIFHVLTFGGLQHLLLVRGSKQSLQQHATKVDALASSYMLLEDDCDAAKLALQALRHHLGGVLDGATYRNERYDVVLRGPDGWRAEQRVGGAAFRVRWQAPDGSALWLCALRVPVGMSAWSTEAADVLLRRMCEQKQLAPVDGGDASQQDGEQDGAWRPVAGDAKQQPGASPNPNGGMRKTVQLRHQAHDDPAAPPRRVLHVQLHHDLLLLVDGYGSSDDSRRAIERAIESLRRD